MWRRSFRAERDPVCRICPAGFLRVAVDQGTGLSGLVAASLGSGEPVPHARQDVDASSVTPTFGRPAETKKARYVVALSRVLRDSRDPDPGVSPSDTVATTGTCEFGQSRCNAIRLRIQ